MRKIHIFDGFMDTATSCLPLRFRCIIQEATTKHVALLQPSSNVISLQKKRISTIHSRQGPICFVVLDTGEDKPDSDIEYAGITVYDEYRTEQAEWLRRVLDSKEYKDAPFKIIVAHIPPIGGWHGNLEVEQKFMPLLRDAKPDVMLCGHLHRFIHQDATDRTPFPIIVNSNTAILKAAADPKELKIQVVDVDGKVVDQFSIKKP